AGSLAGLVPGGPGHSHQSVRDISALGAVPGMSLIEPFTEAELEAALDWAVHRAPGSVYLRLVSVPWALGFDPPVIEEVVPGRRRARRARRRRVRRGRAGAQDRRHRGAEERRQRRGAARARSRRGGHPPSGRGAPAGTISLVSVQAPPLNDLQQQIVDSLRKDGIATVDVRDLHGQELWAEAQADVAPFIEEQRAQ